MAPNKFNARSWFYRVWPSLFTPRVAQQTSVSFALTNNTTEEEDSSYTSSSTHPGGIVDVVDSTSGLPEFGPTYDVMEATTGVNMEQCSNMDLDDPVETGERSVAPNSNVVEPITEVGHYNPEKHPSANPVLEVNNDRTQTINEQSSALQGDVHGPVQSTIDKDVEGPVQSIIDEDVEGEAHGEGHESPIEERESLTKDVGDNAKGQGHLGGTAQGDVHFNVHVHVEGRVLMGAPPQALGGNANAITLFDVGEITSQTTPTTEYVTASSDSELEKPESARINDILRHTPRSRKEKRSPHFIGMEVGNTTEEVDKEEDKSEGDDSAKRDNNSKKKKGWKRRKLGMKVDTTSHIPPPPSNIPALSIDGELPVHAPIPYGELLPTTWHVLWLPAPSNIPPPPIDGEPPAHAPIPYGELLKKTWHVSWLRKPHPFFSANMTEQAWTDGKFRIEKHCLDNWIRRNWKSRWRQTKRGLLGEAPPSIVRRNFMACLYWERVGHPPIWNTVDPGSRKHTNKRVTVPDNLTDIVFQCSKDKWKPDLKRETKPGLKEEEADNLPIPIDIVNKMAKLEGLTYWPEAEIKKLMDDNKKLRMELDRLLRNDNEKTNYSTLRRSLAQSVQDAHALRRSLAQSLQDEHATKGNKDGDMTLFSKVIFEEHGRTLDSHPNVHNFKGKALLIVEDSVRETSRMNKDYAGLSDVEKSLCSRTMSGIHDPNDPSKLLAPDQHTRGMLESIDEDRRLEDMGRFVRGKLLDWKAAGGIMGYQILPMEKSETTRKLDVLYRELSSDCVKSEWGIDCLKLFMAYSDPKGDPKEHLGLPGVRPSRYPQFVGGLDAPPKPQEKLSVRIVARLMSDLTEVARNRAFDDDPDEWVRRVIAVVTENIDNAEEEGKELGREAVKERVQDMAKQRPMRAMVLPATSVVAATTTLSDDCRYRDCSVNGCSAARN